MCRAYTQLGYTSHGARSRCLQGCKTPGTKPQGPCRDCFAKGASRLWIERVRRVVLGSPHTSKVEKSEDRSEENASDKTSKSEIATSDADDDDAVKRLRHKVE